MTVAFASDDRKTIAPRTGRAAEFVICTIENNQVTETRYIANTHTHDHHHDEHENHHSHSEIVESLQGVDLFLVHKIGPNLKKDLEAAKIRYQVIEKMMISEVLEELTEDTNAYL